MTHEGHVKLLPFHLNGTLSPEENGRMESHLADCAECRALLVEASLARKLGRAAPEVWGDHVQAQHLERFVLEPHGLPTHLSAWIEEHLGECPACRDTADEVRRLARPADLFSRRAERAAGPTAGGEPDAGHAPGPGGVLRWLLHPVAAAAYLMLLLILAPVLLLRVGPQPGPEAQPGTAVPRVESLPVLRSPLRGVAGIVHLDLPRGTRGVALAIELPGESIPEGAPLAVAFRRADGSAPIPPVRVPSDRVAQALAGSGLLLVTIPAEDLEPSTYEVSLGAWDAPGATPWLVGTVELRRPPD